MNERDVNNAEKTQQQTNQSQNTDSNPIILQLHISNSLYNKLVDLSKKEGMSNVEDLAKEILAQGVVFKVWEELEKRYSSKQSHQQVDNKGKHKAPLSRSQYFNIMEDKAAFLEYVRSLDKKRK